MDDGHCRQLCGSHAPRGRNQTQKLILDKTTTREKTAAESRTIAQPALSRKSFVVIGRVWSFLGPVGYVFSVLVLFLCISVRLVLGFYEDPVAQNPDQNIPTTQEQKPQVDARAAIGLPVHLKIPRIGVNAVIRSVGLTPDGSIGVPKLPRDAAWYMLGPKPGETGSAVIDGHVNWLYGATGVFAHLNALRAGDLITVQDDRGARTSFVVRKSRSYGQNEDASDIFRSNDGKSHLNLITCGGVWDKASRAYSKRLVVFADRVAD